MQSSPTEKGRPLTKWLLAGASVAFAMVVWWWFADRDPRRAGTRQMAERLRWIASSDQTRPDAFDNLRIAEVMREQLVQSVDAGAKADLRMRIGAKLLLAGKTTDAVNEFRESQRRLVAAGGGFDPSLPNTVRQMLAVAFLRLGEQQNCIEGHGIDSCLLPIQGTGIHKIESGSRQAIAEYERLLEENPDDLTSRWLLNLAHMTLGSYPDAVPEQWRIAPETFASEESMPRFYDIAPLQGLDVIGLAGGSIIEDFNGDGFLDIMASSCGMNDQLRYFRNDGNGSFSDRTVASGLEGLVGGLNICHADYDNDGYPDALVLRGGWMQETGRHPNSLIRNRRDGSFEDVTSEAGVLGFHPTQTAAWVDYDNDGWLDLFIGNESTPGDLHPCELYRNNRNGTFIECAADVGLGGIVGCVKAVAWGDFDNDGFSDLFLSRYAQKNLLFRNVAAPPGPGGIAVRGGRAFSNVSESMPVGDPVSSFASWFWDYDNDGWLDLLVFGYQNEGEVVAAVVADYLGLDHDGALPRLYHNEQGGGFIDVTEETGLNRVILAMGSNFGDLDNDGFLDFYAGTGSPDLRCLIPNRMFRNVNGRAFREVSSAGGFGHLQKGHGISFGDLDNDGDQDIYAVMGGYYTGDFYQNLLFENPGNDAAWITLRLEGVKTNRSAIGARIAITVETPKGTREIHRTVTTGGSFGSSSLQQEIGLGDATAVRDVEVFWPASGETQRFDGLSARRVYRIREGDSEAEFIPTVPIALSPTRGRTRPPSGDGAHDHGVETVLAD